MSEYPECEKMTEVHEESQSIGAFLEWAQEQGFELCIVNETTSRNHFIPIRMSMEELLAKYFEIDLTKVEIERQQMIKTLQESGS